MRGVNRVPLFISEGGFMIKVLRTIPKQDNYWMPGEFEPHAGCWLLFPFRPDVWRLEAQPVQRDFRELVSAISRFEPVTVGVTREQWDFATTFLPEQIRLVEISYDDIWMRDCGPTFVVNGQGGLRGVNWQFNAWGGLYAPWDQDDLVAQKMINIEHSERYDAPFVMEGGAVHVDGEGTIITTKECLLNPNRNPSLTQAQIEQYLIDYLNVNKVIWLENGVYLDETSGHVDNLCCFARPSVLALTWTDDQSDPQYDISHTAYEQLMRERDAKGRPFEIHKIIQPGPLYLTEEECEVTENEDITVERNPGDRLPVSYINFYIANGGIVMPTFNDSHDAEALNALAKLFPEREVVGIYAREIALGGGGIHCITQQQPLV
jgi:agmatine deiminase